MLSILRTSSRNGCPLAADGSGTLALAWTCAACLVNARRCGRTHCRYTGPLYLLLIVRTLVAGWADAPMSEWIALAILILIGGKVIWWATERARGKYDKAAN